MPVELPNGTVANLCGLSSCFREAVGRRGFLPVCEIHKKDPRKFRPDGTFTGSVWARQTKEVPE